MATYTKTGTVNGDNYSLGSFNGNQPLSGNIYQWSDVGTTGVDSLTLGNGNSYLNKYDYRAFTINNADANGVIVVTGASVGGTTLRLELKNVEQLKMWDPVANVAKTIDLTAYSNVNHAPTGSVTIGGTATQNQVLTASNSLADADGLGTITYQWYAAGTAISGATTNTLTLAEAQVGKAITVAANYTDGRGNPESVSSAATTAVVNVNDAPTGSVTISGNAASGQTLTASQTLADADGLGTITYQWNANNVNIAGATGTTYLLTTNETNKTITVTASYTDGHGTLESVTSAATAAVFTNHPPTGTVSIAGTATQNQVLTASNNLADVDGLGAITYQWYADGSAITGAVGTTLTLAEAQVGKAITVRASYTDGHGTPESVPSTATASVVNVNDAPVGAVTVSGTATQNQVLTASNTLTDADGLGTITYQWYAAGTAISGATANTLTLAEAQVGKAVTVVASYTDGHGTLENVTSSATAAVANVNDDPTGSVTFTGTTAQGQQLTAANTLADLDGLGAITYQWKADGANVGTGTTYTLTANDVGKKINVVASYTDGHSTLEQVSSAVAPSGVTISSGTVTGSGGTTVTTTTTMPEAASDFVTPSPLVFDSTGNALLNVSLPAGLGLVETELAGTAIPDLATHLKASDTSISIDQQAGIDLYVGTVTDPTQVTVRTITFPVTPVAPTSPLVISGVLSTGQEALVINTTGLASGTILQLNNVEFALVIGAAHITGGVGDNVVYADGSDQYIVLGAGNDELHGGAGNDTIGSLAGDDKLFGDAGNDTLSGGLGNDTLDGGTGIDTAVFSGNFSDYTITYDTGTSSYTIADNVAGRDGIDVVTNVEHFQFLDVTKDDIIAPTVLSFSPADAATGVAVNSDIVVTFSEAVQHGTGTIDIHVGSATATPVLSYNAATNTTNLTFSASAHTLTINPTADLSAGTHYYVTFSNGSIQDAAGNSYTDSASYDFTTADPFAANNGGGGAGIAIAGVGVLGLLAWVLL